LRGNLLLIPKYYVGGGRIQKRCKKRLKAQRVLSECGRDDQHWEEETQGGGGGRGGSVIKEEDKKEERERHKKLGKPSKHQTVLQRRLKES
jgi:hypothetical protein